MGLTQLAFQRDSVEQRYAHCLAGARRDAHCAGRLEHAHAFLVHARPANEREWTERLFLLGRIELSLGMPRRAAERLETILARRPGLARARLGLARAFFLSARDDKARYHFSASVAEELPSSVEDAVEGSLRTIDARKRWSVSFSASLLPETRRTDREIVLIGGIPFRLNEDAGAPSGVGGLVSAGVSFSPTIADAVRGVNSRTSIEVEPTLEWIEAEADHRGIQLVGLGATFSRAFVGGLSVSFTPSARVRQFADKDPL